MLIDPGNVGFALDGQIVSPLAFLLPAVFLACPRPLGQRVLATRRARVVPGRLPLRDERAQGRPGARCTRGLVCNVHKEVRTRAYRSSGEHPAFPAQWLYGLCRALPGDEFLL